MSEWELLMFIFPLAGGPQGHAGRQLGGDTGHGSQCYQAHRPVKGWPPLSYHLLQQALHTAGCNQSHKDLGLRWESWKSHSVLGGKKGLFVNFWVLDIPNDSLVKSRSRGKLSQVIKNASSGFPGGLVVKNPPVNAGGMSSIPGLGRSPMPGANWTHGR